MSTNDAWKFFYNHAGWSYDPARETAAAGRKRGAMELASAEAWAKANDVSFQWMEDPEGADVQKDDGSWETLPAVMCFAARFHECDRGHLHREIVASLCGITESDDAKERAGYRRIVEAQLALEAMS